MKGLSPSRLPDIKHASQDIAYTKACQTQNLTFSAQALTCGRVGKLTGSDEKYLLKRVKVARHCVSAVQRPTYKACQHAASNSSVIQGWLRMVTGIALGQTRPQCCRSPGLAIAAAAASAWARLGRSQGPDMFAAAASAFAPAQP